MNCECRDDQIGHTCGREKNTYCMYCGFSVRKMGHFTEGGMCKRRWESKLVSFFEWLSKLL